MDNDLKTVLITAAVICAVLLGMLIALLVLWGISYKVHPENQRFMESAKNRLKGKWTIPVLSLLIYYGITFGTQSIQQGIGGIFETLTIAGSSNPFATVAVFAFFVPLLLLFMAVNLFLSSTLTVGLYGQILKLVRSQPIEIGDLFTAIKDAKLRITSVCTVFLVAVNVLLRMLLLIVPGLMAAYSYSLVYFILAENPEMSAREVLRKSKEMMYGHRAELFWLSCRFSGWMILCIFTLGIGFLWWTPYLVTAFGEFYENRKRETNVPLIGEHSVEL